MRRAHGQSQLGPVIQAGLRRSHHGENRHQSPAKLTLEHEPQTLISEAIQERLLQFGCQPAFARTRLQKLGFASDEAGVSDESL
jgi:hypothetical protein